jgi:hypothetical protein
MQYNRRDRDCWLFRKLGLDGLECGLTLRRTVAVLVGMDRTKSGQVASRPSKAYNPLHL